NHICYLDQNATFLKQDLTVLENFTQLNPQITENDSRLILAQFLFSGDSVLKTARCLSGGEMTRLHLAKVFMHNADFIILDEPTNNLDTTAKTMLYQTIENWRDGLLIVSHDRSLLQLMDQILELTTLGLNTYGGNYDHYLEQKAIHQQALQNRHENASH
ncbi:unnamed protein product, partial [marine sediment metagenome]